MKIIWQGIWQKTHDLLGPGSGSWAPKCDKHMKIIWKSGGGPGPGRLPAAALGPGPRFRAPKCENDMKIIWKKYENHVIWHFHIMFTLFPYYFHMFITFWGSRARSGPQKSYFCQIPGHVFFILFSYVWISLGWGPCPFRNLWNPHWNWGSSNQTRTRTHMTGQSDILDSLLGPRHIR